MLFSSGRCCQIELLAPLIFLISIAKLGTKAMLFYVHEKIFTVYLVT
jgi:hypothetical protein